MAVGAAGGAGDQVDGRVKEFWVDRGYGFIAGDDGRDYFVNYSYILDGDDLKYLERGEVVTFEPVKTVRGLQAHHVQRATPVGTTLAHQNWVPAKRNPFTPQDPMADPMLFAGREQYVDLGLDALVNNQNILVTGTRGVGKSSFSSQMLTISTGDFTLLDQLVIPNPEHDVARLAVQYTCEPGDALEIIAASIAATVEDAVGSDAPAKSTSTFGFKSVVEATHSFEYVEGENASVAAAFADSVVRACQSCDGEYDGICILIDEVDVLSTEVQLASFLKAAVETIRQRNVANVSFVLVGISGEITDLIRQHASFTRLFMNIHLDPMDVREQKEIVIRALKGTDVNIHPQALDLLVASAGRLPASVQLLGYYSYKSNSDDHIDTGDVREAVAIVVKHVRKQLYRDLREQYALATEFSEALLQTLLEYGRINPKVAADSANLGEAAAEAGLERLREANALDLDGGLYSLRDPLFGEFLKVER